MFVEVVQTGETEIKELQKLNIELRDRLKNSKERDEQQKVVEPVVQTVSSFINL